MKYIFVLITLLNQSIRLIIQLFLVLFVCYGLLS